MLNFEEKLWEREFRLVAGVDEAGRGPLAGPVVACAVVLPPWTSLPGLDDSKKLSPLQRERLYSCIRDVAVAISVARAEAEEIDRLNIHQASLLAMRRAVEGLGVEPEYVLVDGRFFPEVELPGEAIVGGDGRSLCIAAASVVAKVLRDRLMAEYDRVYPQYGFARHKGYPTPEHLRALRKHGPCPIHRISFRGVK
ncbi:MAG TPA: ribonuclease HII [Candidatus Latescibacteria bacterium]|nr:ribonuclease HII [Candidatus Latescibacterota bacterium]